MCCVIRIAGESAGRRAMTSRIASVPPVEAPIAINFSVDSREKVLGRTFGSAVAPLVTRATRGAVAGPWRCIRAREATRIFSQISRPSSVNPEATPTRGLATKSIAPNSSARKVTSAPRSVSVDTITTGVGRKRISFSRKSMPSIFGISTSSVSTSGFRARIISRATSGSGAAPIASMSLCLLMISVSRLRTSAESSMINTRVLFTLVSSFGAMVCAVPCQGSEQFDVAHHGLGLQSGAILTFRRHQRGVRLRQLLAQRAAGGGKESDATRTLVEQITGSDADAFGGEKLEYEIGVALADIDTHDVGHHVAAAEYLRFEIRFARAALEQFIDQLLHGEHAITSSEPARVAIGAVGQHEVVHAADALRVIPDTSRDARAQHRGQDDVVVGHEKFTEQDLDRMARKIAIEVEVLSFADDAACARPCQLRRGDGHGRLS